MLQVIVTFAGAQPKNRRQGMVLLVVMVMLALFASVALSFMFYAEAEALASRNARDHQFQFQPDVDPELLINYALGSLIYDHDDRDVPAAKTYANVYNAARGWSLARNLYGYYFDPALPTPQPNFIPHSGVGTPTNYNEAALGQLAINLPNYTYFPGDGFVRDRERLGTRLTPAAAVTAPYAGANIPYTAADLQNTYLAAVTAKGEVLLQSFFRSWTGIGALDSSNKMWDAPNWTVEPPAWMKYATLRPMPYVDPYLKSIYPGQPAKYVINYSFAPPEDGGGDVQNLDWGRGVPNPAGGYYVNDSIWIDLGHPVLNGVNGRKYKPLFAPLIMDLEGKLNINAIGNARGRVSTVDTFYFSASNQGLGPWEINPRHALTQTDWLNILQGNFNLAGNSYPANKIPGRYGFRQGIIPSSPYPTKLGSFRFVSGGTPIAYYGRGDLDATAATAVSPFYGAPSKKVFYPGESTNTWPPYFGWPFLDAATYQNGSLVTEQKDHPWLYNVFYPKDKAPPAFAFAPANNRIFEPFHFEALWRYGGTNSPALRSEFFRIGDGATPNFNALSNPNAARLYRMLAPRGWDFGRPGLVPWLYSATDPAVAAGQAPNPAYTLAAGNLYPKSTPGSFGPIDPSKPIPTTGEFSSTGAYRGMTIADDPSFLLTWKRLNLQRSLPDWPSFNPLTGRVDLSVNPVTLKTYYQEALDARQKFAQDLFDLLRLVCMGARPTDPLPANPSADYDAARYLAQLAVNMVDYRDQDLVQAADNANGIPAAISEYFTPFHWDTADPNAYVFGTELPRVVLNEVYCDAINDPADATKVKLNFWIELLNPLKQDNALNEPLTGQPPTLQPSAAMLYNDQGAGYAAYQIQILDSNDVTTIRDASNSAGNPNSDPTKIKAQIKDLAGWTALANGFTVQAGVEPRIIQALDTNYSGPNGSNQGFYLLGPDTGAASYQFPGTDPAKPQATLRLQNGLAYGGVDPATIDPTNPVKLIHTVVLRRLLCPYLDPQPDPALALTDPTKPYNPYITVDYIQGITVNNNAATAGGLTPLAVDKCKSQGRKQPYAAYYNSDQTKSQVMDQAPSPPLMNQPQHTFFLHNGSTVTASNPPTSGDSTLTLPFDWLVHLDRNLMSPAELLFVSGFRPHELTQQFMKGNSTGIAITNATNASPIVVTSAAHGLQNGDQVRVSAVTGNTAANGLFFITVIDADNFALNGSTANGVYASGGIWTARFNHQAPWLDAAARIYRLLEFVDAGWRGQGVSQEGRFPGRININDVWDREVWLALLDPKVKTTDPDSASFPQQACFIDRDAAANNPAGNMFKDLMTSRNPDQISGIFVPGPNGRPFLSLNAAFTSNSKGVEDTLLRAYPGDPGRPPTDPGYPGRRLFDLDPNVLAADTTGVPKDHPYFVKEPLRKIFNNVTTRSNVFGVFLTVGFFDVTEVASKDSAGNDVTIYSLGKEIGKAEGRNVRHRMFSIVDRSELTLFNLPYQGTIPVDYSDPVNKPLPQALTIGKVPQPPLPAPPAAANGRTYNIQKGMLLTIQSDQGLEDVLVTDVDAAVPPTWFTANFQRKHDTNIVITARGNPGPTPSYNARNDPVVQYFSIIK
ncbi:MAG: hypothetical protein HY040_13990 [Planctomycetes bacterium]|nr:hypothetical protein [Planctomycetota bacterium]